MKATTVFGLLGLSAIAYWFSRQANTVTQLSYFIAGLRYNKKNSTALRSEILLTLRIQNPTTNTVRFDGFSGTLKMAGNTLASVSLNKQFDGIALKPGDNDITIPVGISHLSALQAIVPVLKSLFAGVPVKDPVDVSGTLTAAGLQFPITQKINLSFLDSIAGTNCNSCKTIGV